VTGRRWRLVGFQGHARRFGRWGFLYVRPRFSRLIGVVRRSSLSADAARVAAGRDTAEARLIASRLL